MNYTTILKEISQGLISRDIDYLKLSDAIKGVFVKKPAAGTSPLLGSTRRWFMNLDVKPKPSGPPGRDH